MANSLPGKVHFVEFLPHFRRHSIGNIAYLSKFLTPNGKIQSRKRTGFGGQNQRALAQAIKNARLLGLLPFVGRS